MKKKPWVIKLVASIIIAIGTGLPALNYYFDWNMPFVHIINGSQLKYFGFTMENPFLPVGICAVIAVMCIFLIIICIAHLLAKDTGNTKIYGFPIKQN